MSKKDVKVSVIIPVYNAEEHLKECLDSIINQTLKDIEIICVDDGSTDTSLQILNSYAQNDERIQVLTQQNKFAGVARNTGLSAANGNYYVFLDSDDFFEPDLLELEYAKCEEYNADIAVCAADKFDNKTKEFQPAPWLLDLSLIKEEPFSKDSVSNIYGVSAANPWTKMFSSEFVKKHGLQFQALQRSNDAFFVLTSLALAKRIVAVDKVLVHYRVGQTTNLQSNTTTTDSFCKALSEVKRHLEKCNEFEKVEQSFANIVLAQIQYNLSSFQWH